MLNSLGVTPLFTRASAPHARGLPIWAYERILLDGCMNAPFALLSLTFSGPGTAANKEESTRLRLPAVEHSGTFRIDPILPPRPSWQLNRSHQAEQLQQSTDQDTAPDLCQLTVGLASLFTCSLHTIPCSGTRKRTPSTPAAAARSRVRPRSLSPIIYISA